MAELNQLAEPTPQKRPATISELLHKPETIKRFQQITPRHLSPERLLRVMTHAIYKTPRLGDCSPLSLLGAMQACASLGLEPNTSLGHAYLVPFKKSKLVDGKWVEIYEVQLIIGYRGLIDLARRSGILVSLHADVVYEGDEFSFEYGTNMHLRHRPGGSRVKPLWAYAHASLKEGQAFEVLSYSQVLQIRDESQGYKAALAAKADAARGKSYRLREYESAPWVKFEHDMSVKTMVRRLAKWLPLSLEFANAVALDQMSEVGKVDFAAFANMEPASLDPDLALIANDDSAERSALPPGPDQEAESPRADQRPTAGDGVLPAQLPPAAPVAEAAKQPLFGVEG